MTVGVLGESLVDVFTDASGTTTERPGGSPFNVAIALARLEIDVVLLTAVGDDERGQALLARLDADGVATARGQAESTPVARATLDPSGAATYDFDLTWDPQFGNGLPEVDVLHFGSLGAIVTPGADQVRTIVDRYARTSLITYDPNWREGVVDSEPRSLVEANARRCDVVKLSHDDADAIYPGTALEDVAHRLLSLGPALVVITKGAAGASGWTAKTEKHVSSAHVDVADTVGAGDAFMATLLSELAEFERTRVEALSRRELELVLEFSAFVAGKTCERHGADPPRLAELF